MRVLCKGADEVEIVNFICDRDAVDYIPQEEHQFAFSSTS